MRTKSIAKWVAGCLVLTAVVCGVIYYGPDVLERIKGRDSNSLSILELWNNRDQLLGREVSVVVKGVGDDILRSEIRLDNLYYWTGDYSIMDGVENITQDVDMMIVAMPLEYESWGYWEEPIYLFGKEDQTQYADRTWSWLDKLQITGVLTTITFSYNEYHWEFGTPQSHVWYIPKSENVWALEVTNVEVLARWPYS